MNGTVSSLLLVTGLLVFASMAWSLPDYPTELAPVRLALDSNNSVEAIALIEALHERGQETTESYYLLGLAYQLRIDEVGLLSKRKVSRQLQEALTRALALDPNNVSAHEELADFYFFAPGIVGGSKSKASVQIEVLEQASPAYANRVRGRHAYNSGQYRQAEAHFTRSLNQDEMQAEVWYLRGLARVKLLEKDEAALLDFDRAIALGYDELIMYYHIGRLCVRLGGCASRGEESLKYFIALSDGRYRAFGHYRLAQLYELNDRLEESLEQASASLEDEPELEAARALLERVKSKLEESSG